MRFRLLLLAALVAPAPAVLGQRTPARTARPARAAATPSPSQVLNPAVRTGRLANGLTYYILRNTEPRNRAELYLAVNAGSAMEDDDQKGLAHLLEHMLFNGTARFPKQDLVRYLESTGMRFGGDVNAYTSFDETVYTLTVPTDSARIFQRAFDVLRDWAGAATLSPAEIDRERGVVVEEWRVRDQNAQGRVRTRVIPELLPGSRYAQRLPIGDTLSLRHAPASALQRFYRDWYRPSLMAVVVVGDVDVAATEARIRQEFSTLRNPARPRPRPVLPAPRATGTRYLAVADPEFPATTVQVFSQRPATPSKTVAEARADIVEGLFAGMFNRRLDELRRSAEAPFVGAGIGTGSLVRPADQVSLIVQTTPEGVETGYAALLREAERVRRHGFTAAELAQQKAEVLRQYQTAYAERERTPSARLAQALVQHFLTGEIPQSAEADLRLVEQALPSITLADVNAAARRDLDPARGRLVAFVGTDRPGAAELTTEALRALDQRLAAQLRTEAVAAYEQAAADTTLMERRPVPGTVAGTAAYDALGATVFTLGNGMKVVVKPTTFKADEVRFTLTHPGGSSRVADADVLAASLAPQVATQSGVGRFTQTALERLLAGKQVRVAPYVSDVEEGFNGMARPQDLETAFQLLHLYATAPRFDGAALDALKTQSRAMLSTMGATPQGVLQDSLGQLLFRPSPRILTSAQRLAALETVTLLDVQRLYDDRFSDFAGATLTMVGNVDVPTAQRLAQTYLATLPGTQPETFDAAALPQPRTDDVAVNLYKGVAPQSQVVMLFQGPAEATQEAEQRIGALSNVLSIRLREKVREELSGTYGIQVQGTVAERPTPLYQFIVFFACDPQRVDELSAAVRAEIGKVMADGPTAQEVTTAQEQQRRARQTGLEQNAFWLNALDEAFAWPTGQPDEVLGTYEALVDATSGARIQEDARRYFGPAARTVRIVVYPEAMRPAGQ